MYHYKAVVTRVVDGDTFDAQLDLGFGITFSQRFRVVDLDTPETFRPKSKAEKEHGLQATDKATSLLSGCEVEIQSKKAAGIYGRYAAIVTLPDGRDYATVMKEAGMVKKENYDDAV